MKKLKVCWLSAGVSSFMAGYLAGDIDMWVYCDINDQHEDSMRFIKDIEQALGISVLILKSPDYSTVEECVRAFGGFKNPYTNFAPCTNWLKKRLRKEWEQLYSDCELTYVWGFDYSEKDRAERLCEANPHAQHEFPLIDKGLSKKDVHGLFESIFDFERPLLYRMGYPNNNCIGCLKGGMGYWNMIRKDFPDVFNSRAKLEREMGFSILKNYYLDELPEDAGNFSTEVMPECGMMCYFTMME